MKFNQLGSVSLTTLFSTASGVLFVLTFFNLASYVGASGAVKEAARKTARCVTPTDPECVSVNADTGDYPKDWFGIRNSTDEPPLDLNVRTFKYEASMPSTLWGASYNSYTTRVADQSFNLGFQEIPVKTFRAKSPYSIPSGVNSATFTVTPPAQFAPRSIPNFPIFQRDQDIAAAVQNEIRNSAEPLEEWRAWRKTQPVPFEVDSSNLLSIPAGGENFYITETITVPLLRGEPSQAIDCANDACDVAVAAGSSSASGDDWKDYAHIAIKVFAEVRSTTPGRTTSLEFDSNGDEPGLEVTVEDEQGIPQKRCLGSAGALKGIGNNFTSYKMWIRGPAGSFGGRVEDAVCSDGTVAHDYIRVPRGSSFTVTSRLTNTGSHPAEAKFHILTYFDNPEPVETAPKQLTCQSLNYSGYNNSAEANREQACSLDSCIPVNCDLPGSFCPAPGQTLSQALNRHTYNLNTCVSSETSAKYTCKESEKVTPDSSQLLDASSTLTKNIAVCDADWALRAFTEPSGERDNSDFACGYNEGEMSSKKVQVASLSGSCALAAPANSENEQCANPLLTTETANSENCPIAFARLKEISEQTIEVNNTQTNGAQSFGTEAILTFNEKTNETDAFSWTPQGDFTKQAISLSAEQGIEKPNKKSRQDYKPSADDFISRILSSSEGSESSLGWQEFSNNASSLVQVNKLETRTLKIDSEYPFGDEAVHEIYYGQVDHGAQWDFDSDCDVEPSCECLSDDSCGDDFDRFESLEQMLRHHASKQVPEAADEEFVFNYSNPEHIGFENIGLVEKQDINFPTCFPLRGVCRDNRENAEMVFLESSTEKPAACSDGTFSECRGVIPEGQIFDEPEINTEINTVLARQKGLAELQDIFPFATLEEECGDVPGCTQISVDTSSGIKADVTVNYQMPITFPLSSILQQDSIAISYTKSEVIERAIAGTSARFKNF